MKIKAVLFDLDGTLLPMDQDLFIKVYLGSLAQKMIKYGYEPKKLVETIWLGTAAMIQNDGLKYNETVFWDTFVKVLGERVLRDSDKLDAFYQKEFDLAKEVCGFNPKAKMVVDEIKHLGLKVVLATNPIFPSVATEKRMKWAGFSPDDFEFFTTYENSRFCKPNVAYYKDIVSQLGVLPEECLMVGNDVTEDMVAQKLGMKVFLLPACIINRDNKDISCFPHGDFDDLLAFIKENI